LKPTHKLTATTLTSSTPKPISRKQLNELQIEVLQILYKFRFATAELISQYQEQSIRNSNVRLKNLLEQKYIGRNYDDSYRIKQWPATYYLLPDGIRFLKANPELDKKGLHLSYNSRWVKPEFTRHWLRMFRIYLKFDSIYRDDLEFFTSTELTDQQKFPRPISDAFLSFRSEYANNPDYMLELMESNISLARLRQRVNRFMYHSQTGNWTGNYPIVLLICDNVGLERELQNYIARTLNYRGLVKPTYYTTTLRALFGSRIANDAIWSEVTKPEVLLVL